MKASALLVILVLLLFGAGDAWSKPGKSRGGLKNKQCAAVCQHLLACEGMSLDDSATAAEFLICNDDCHADSEVARIHSE